MLERSQFWAPETALQVFLRSSQRNVVCWTGLISGYCCNGLVEEARNLFDSMPERNVISYSAMIFGYILNGFFIEAIDLYLDLKVPLFLMHDCAVLMSVLRACASIGALEFGKCVHTLLHKAGFSFDLEIATTLIDFYSKCRSVDKAIKVFDRMPLKDVSAWSSMMMGFAINSQNSAGLEFFKEMEAGGLQPNAITFVAVVSACNEKSLVPNVWQLLGRMAKVYTIMPEIEHYGCVIDVLARAGQVAYAEILIRSMPIRADGAIFGSLFSGCLIHGYFESGARVGRMLLELEPEHSGRYVLLANMYAALSKWDDVEGLRKLMSKRGVVTVEAWSFVEVDGVIHKFVVDDKSHVCSTQIHVVLHHLKREAEMFLN